MTRWLGVGLCVKAGLQQMVVPLRFAALIWSLVGVEN